MPESAPESDTDAASWLALLQSSGRVSVWARDLRGLSSLDDGELLLRSGFGGPASGDAAALDVLEDDRAALASRLRVSIGRSGHHAARFRARQADGRLQRLDLRWTLQRSADGRPERLQGLLIDDSEAHALAHSSSEIESQLALALDLGGISVWRHDLPSGRMHYSTQGWLTLGLAPRPEGLSIDEVRAMVHPDDLPGVLASAEAALKSGQPADVEARYRHADGSWRPQLLRRVVQRDASGRATAFLGVALDVTERQQQRRRADDMARRFETVTRAAGIGHWVHEPGQQRPVWSDQLRAMFGLEPTDPAPTLPEWLQRHVHPDDRDGLRRAMQNWLQAGPDSVEYAFRALRPDGSVRQLFSHSQLEAGSAGPLVFGVVVDITERRRSELALQHAQDRVALAARAAGLGTWELELDSGDVHWDETMWRMRGRTPQPGAMTAAQYLACVHPQDRQRAGAQLQDAAARGSTLEHQFRVVWPDGSVHWINSRSMQVTDADGRRRRIGVNWDSTDSRNAETVRQERELARRESTAKSQFLARMSHELRTPLNAVLGFAQLLLSDEPGADAAGQSRRRRLDHIRSAGQHLLTLINDVLDLSGLESGELRMAVVPVALRPLLEESLPMLGTLPAERQVHIELGAIEQRVMADPTRLRQVLLNLLSNAVKYNHAGGNVRVQAVQEGDWVRVRVADSGRGLTPAQLAQVFEPFNRLGHEGGSIEGSGIGLAIVKALMQRMGGSVQVESRPGEGSVFELRLKTADAEVAVPAVVRAPAAPVPQAEAVASAVEATGAAGAAGAASPRRRGVLYIEDNPVNALIIAELVARRRDLVLHIAADGASGVTQARTLRPELILLDMQLPDFDGYEVLRRLRAEPQTAAIPCIALSANAMPADIERALRAGVSDYWTKPLDFKAFMASLDALFGVAS